MSMLRRSGPTLSEAADHLVSSDVFRSQASSLGTKQIMQKKNSRKQSDISGRCWKNEEACSCTHENPRSSGISELSDQITWFKTRLKKKLADQNGATQIGTELLQKKWKETDSRKKMKTPQRTVRNFWSQKKSQRADSCARCTGVLPMLHTALNLRGSRQRSGWRHASKNNNLESGKNLRALLVRTRRRACIPAGVSVCVYLHE